MRKLFVSQFMTLDGVVQSPGHPNEDRTGGFDRGGWQTPYFDQDVGAALFEGFAASDTLLLGRKTYDIFASFWPHQPAEDPVAATMNTYKKYVVSSTLSEPLTWQNSTLVAGDVAERVAELKREPGKGIQVLGSGALVQTLVQHDLVDEYHLLIHPVVVGKGKRLFERGASATLKLISSRVTSAGVVVASYEHVPAGVS
jgi:dihydrofolate reductase